MSIFIKHKGTDILWYTFEFDGKRIRKSTGQTNIAVARTMERKYHSELEQGLQDSLKPQKVGCVDAGADEFLKLNTPTWAPGTLRYHESNLKHIRPVFGDFKVSNVTAIDIAEYQAGRLEQGAANRTVNMEVSTLKAILDCAGFPVKRSAGKKKVKMLKVPRSKGQVVPAEVAAAYLEECSKSRQRSLATFIILAIETGARYGTLKMLHWENIDFMGRCLQWGKDKTDAGSFRTVPLTERAMKTLQFWAGNFPNRKPGHFVFPFEKVGAKGHKFGKAEGAGVEGVAYETDPTRPIDSMKTAINAARGRTEVRLSLPPKSLTFRTHDFRHTAFTQMRNRNVPMEKTAAILGWSPSNMVRMASIYGHFSLDDLRQGTDALGYAGMSPLGAMGDTFGGDPDPHSATFGNNGGNRKPQ